ncbi:hypothetical protein AJ87_33410 [Rhizobium yanglingense]|nr:hypothetical protein AJ87_33410 [Rhizobium yanglingense]
MVGRYASRCDVIQTKVSTALSILGRDFARSSRVHDRLDLNPGIKRKEPWLSNGRHLRGVRHVEENQARSFPVEFSEVGRSDLRSARMD